MNHADHVNLIRPADLPHGGTWADFGAGSGAFTLALRELIGPDATIYAVDKDRHGLERLERSHAARFITAANLIPLNEDFSRSLNLPPLDGVIMANSLHFFRDRVRVLGHVRSFLKPGGRLLLIEYNVDSGNPWVPYPLSFETFRVIAQRADLGEPRLLAKNPSSFLHEFYSAICENIGTR